MLQVISELARRPSAGVCIDAGESCSHLRCHVWKYLPLGRRGPYTSLRRTTRRPRSPKLAGGHRLVQLRDAIVGRMVATKSVVHVADLAADPGYIERTLSGQRLHAVELGGVRTLLAVPMLRENELIGAFISISPRGSSLHRQADRAGYRTSPRRPSSPSRTRGCSTSSASAPNDLSESLQQQTATSEVLGVISKSPGELKPVFQAMLENAVRICNAKFGVLALSEGDAFRLAALHGAPPAYAEARRREPVMRFGPGTATDRRREDEATGANMPTLGQSRLMSTIHSDLP